MSNDNLMHDDQASPDYSDQSYLVPDQPVMPAPAAPAPAPEDVRAAAKKAGAASSPFQTPVPSPWMAPYLGVGGLPQGVARFNWGAMFLPFWWALAYGMTRWAALGFGVLYLSNQVTRFLPDSVGMLIGLGQIAFSIWFGFAINRAYWASNPKSLTVEEFNRKQVKWIVIGALVTVLVYVFIFYLTFASI